MTISAGGGILAEYKETPYEDQSWEVIDQVDPDPQFEPLDLEMIRTVDINTTDEFFNDYGGRLPETPNNRLFHGAETGSNISCANKEEELLAEIENIKLEHQKNLAHVKEEGRQEGLKQGRDEGMKEALAREEQASDILKLIFEDMLNQLNEAIRKIEAEAVKFSMLIAEKLIGQAVEINPEYIVPLVKEALSKSGTAVITRVRVSPEDLEFIEVVGVRKVIQEFDGQWDFEADPTVRSGCIVDTSAGEIDYRLDEAWKRISEQVVRVAK